ncbi:serine/threonine-protein kinase/endoribonuclease IRE1b-like protein [Tanacetum coccineum]|uniref:Serine/threonine-protein kinase/endoribonuclease IRE1b-like protein n=1 Tax=Tanacetum coccineum TaxID=301880 RepID=A0ABQ5IZ24_9ASTR
MYHDPSNLVSNSKGQHNYKAAFRLSCGTAFDIVWMLDFPAALDIQWELKFPQPSKYTLKWNVFASAGIEGLAECKASTSNLRRIQIKDIVKEVEDHLKTYSSAGMDICNQDSVLLAAPDGNIYQVNISSGKILWSIPTGPPIYDAHQSPNLEDDEHNSSRQQNNFYIDCGDDWQLYIHDKNSKAEKLPFSVEELIGKTPHVSADGVLIGSKNTTVFLVDPETGDVINTFKSDATLSSEQSSIILKKTFMPCLGSTAFLAKLKAQLSESVLVNDPENPHQLVPYIPRIPHQPDDKHAKDVSVTHGILASIKMWVLELLAAALSIFIPLIVCCWNFGRRKQNKLNETVMVTKVQNVTPKKKKPRKSGNSKVDANTEMIMNGFQFTRSFERKIGKLLVSDKEIGKGSNGTIVLEGVYDARCVAVKHILKVYHDVALKEIQILIESDEHTNIVRWHGVDSSTQVQSSMEVFKDFKLWNPNGYPSPVLLKVMRDLKPQNVLIRKDRSIITAKVSDMGISRRLPDDMSCLTKSATGKSSLLCKLLKRY